MMGYKVSLFVFLTYIMKKSFVEWHTPPKTFFRPLLSGLTSSIIFVTFEMSFIKFNDFVIFPNFTLVLFNNKVANVSTRWKLILNSFSSAIWSITISVQRPPSMNLNVIIIKCSVVNFDFSNQVFLIGLTQTVWFRCLWNYIITKDTNSQYFTDSQYHRHLSFEQLCAFFFMSAHSVKRWTI